jgi:hypothetical protein
MAGWAWIRFGAILLHRFGAAMKNEQQDKPRDTATFGTIQRL